MCKSRYEYSVSGVSQVGSVSEGKQKLTLFIYLLIYLCISPSRLAHPSLCISVPRLPPGPVLSSPCYAPAALALVPRSMYNTFTHLPHALLHHCIIVMEALVMPDIRLRKQELSRRDGGLVLMNVALRRSTQCLLVP